MQCTVIWPAARIIPLKRRYVLSLVQLLRVLAPHRQPVGTIHFAAKAQQTVARFEPNLFSVSGKELCHANAMIYIGKILVEAGDE